MDIGYQKRMDDLVSRNHELNLKLFNAENENEGMKAVIERLGSDLYSLAEKSEITSRFLLFAVTLQPLARGISPSHEPVAPSSVGLVGGS